MSTISFKSPEEAIQHLAERVECLEAKTNAQLIINTILVAVLEASDILPASSVRQVCLDKAQDIEKVSKDPAGIRKVIEVLEEQFSNIAPGAEIIRGNFGENDDDAE